MSGTSESISPILFAEAFVREKHEEQRFKNANKELRDLSVKSFGIMVLFDSCSKPFVLLFPPNDFGAHFLVVIFNYIYL